MIFLEVFHYEAANVGGGNGGFFAERFLDGFKGFFDEIISGAGRDAEGACVEF